MPYITHDVEIEIDVDNFLYECSESEIEELIELLKDQGYLKNPNKKNLSEDNMLDKEYHANLDKLYGNRINLTLEEEETIRKIASRF